VTSGTLRCWRDLVRWLTIPLALSVVTHASTDDTSVRAVVEAASAYVAEYQQQLTSILADEIYSQEIVQGAEPAARASRTRHMRSEVFFMFLSGDREWMAIRDVIAVDGRPVDERPDIRHALRTLPARDVAETFKTHNSRFNIGRTFRNFNEPTLSLLVLEANHHERFSFKRKRIVRDGDAVLVTLTFVEKKTPTLIRGLTGGRLFSTGEILVEAGTGRVRRALLHLATDDVKVELATTYLPQERLGLWVPTVFRERYEHATVTRSKDAESGFQREQVVCEARYSNFRRFETDVRVR
jgi:hypothetical protein